MKRCERCELPKPKSAFYQREDGVGLYAWCQACMRQEGRLKLTKQSKLQQEKGYIR